MEYKKKYIDNSGNYEIWEFYPNGHSRKVFETRPAYLEWLALGNIPAEIPYTPPALLPLDDYKKLKKAEIDKFCIADLKTLFVSADTESLLFDQLFAACQGIALIDKQAMKKLDLTPGEVELLDSLRDKQDQTFILRNKSDSLKQNIDNAADYAAVEDVIW